MADPSTAAPLTRTSVQAAHELIKRHVHRTPVLTNRTLTALASTPRDGDGSSRPVIRLWFKCENLQRVGAFKVRGAFHAVGRLLAEPGWAEGGGRERGVVTHSSGGFGFLPFSFHLSFLSCQRGKRCGKRLACRCWLLVGSEHWTLCRMPG